jgi:hypothetical protein
MQTLAHQRCFNHAGREAVARCPECKQFFCRECVTEHDDRVLCSLCLKKSARPPLARRLKLTQIFRALQFAFSILLVWYFFFLIGEGLLKIPTSFHDGSIWQAHWINEDE